MVSCSQCQSTDHSLSAWPIFAQQLATSQDQGQVNAAFQRPKFDPYSSGFNSEWAKHPNFSWIRPSALMPNNQGGGFQGNSSFLTYQNPPF